MFRFYFLEGDKIKVRDYRSPDKAGQFEEELRGKLYMVYECRMERWAVFRLMNDNPDAVRELIQRETPIVYEEGHCQICKTHIPYDQKICEDKFCRNLASIKAQLNV